MQKKWSGQSNCPAKEEKRGITSWDEDRQMPTREEKPAFNAGAMDKVKMAGDVLRIGDVQEYGEV